MVVESLIISPWHDIVSIKRKKLFLREATLSYELGVYSGAPKYISGWYAKYPEGIFILFRSSDGKIKIGFKDKLLDIEQITSIVWSASFKKRSFKVIDERNELLSEFNYNRTINYVFRPWKFFFEAFVPDDDWGLEADLPSFVDSCFKNRNVQKSVLNLLARTNS